MNAIALTIGNISIRQDSEGRYCLNDLHKASGGENKNKPSLWLNNQQTQDLIKEIEIAGNPAIFTKQGLGTFAVKARLSVDDAMANELNEEMEKLEQCIVRAWTEMDEALHRMSHATLFLRRWRGRK